MPNWNDLLEELRVAGSTHDLTRRKYLKQLYKLTGRNVIVYYSGWLQKGILQQHVGAIEFAIDEMDKTAFMAAIHKLDRSKGLDLILHTPGGDTAVTESLVNYLRSMFGNNIRAIVPQIAMSAGTMIALACKQIVMGKHSSLGPIDPQYGGIPAHGIIEEVTRGVAEIQADNAKAFLWQVVFQKYNPTLIGECEKAIKWTEEIVKKWLVDCMFEHDEDATQKANRIYEELSDHSLTKSHNRRISMETIRGLGINLVSLEDDQKLQEAVMSVHHTCMLTLDQTVAYKIIENHLGTAYIRQIRPG
ncbi:MAG: hypothetical protein FOGNACKC_02221 [Anaerolineae bacterium]|nr:hypothetical protein [Anaerolineae bacterium]